MKIKTKKSRKKPIIITIATLLLLVGGATVFTYSQKLGPFEEKEYSTKSASSDEKKTGQNTKKESLEKSEAQKGSTGSDPAPAPTPSTDGGKSTVGMEITAANQNGGTFNVRTLIQMVTSTGICSLRMTGPNGNVYTATADIQALPSSSTCKGFDIPTANLSSGDWTVAVSFENEEVKGTATKEVEIK